MFNRPNQFQSALCAFLFTLAWSACCAAASEQDNDPYEAYVRASNDFRQVRQDPKWCNEAFPSWTYMPWTYQWGIGYDDAAGKWSVQHGYNGAFIDHGDPGNAGSKTGRLDWIDRYKLRFYVDHVASKHYLHLWDGNEVKPHLQTLHSNGIRTTPLNADLLKTLQTVIRKNLAGVKASPNRAAYALDDEISWGHFVHPTMWCVTDDKEAYAKWLKEIYGANLAPVRPRWLTYDDIRPNLDKWSVGNFDASPLMDQWTFNDSYWNNFLGDLVEYTNTVDPHTPCGFVGGQCPNAFGGYDYAKVMRKVQFIEAYNMGSSQALIRSFNPNNAIPSVTSHFHKSVEDDVWQTWYYLAHGNRGMIGWVEGWFDGTKPKPWHDAVAPTYLEAGKTIGPLLAGATWKHDGVAIYYSHASIQLGWILDAQSHGKTWTNRNGDDRLGASHAVRHAWENMLRDEGLQYSFLNYVDLIQKGVPAEYKVLILPACICLSDAEAKQIRAFCRAGGTVVADYLPGLWDQHGKGRAAGGAIDDLFGVRHAAALHAEDLFNGNKLWCEVDQDANFSWKTQTEFLTNKNQCLHDESGFSKAVRQMPIATVKHADRGTAVLMNLSPQWYNAFREKGREQAARRSTFMRPLHDAGLSRWVELKDAPDAAFGYEITYMKKAGRTFVLLCLNPEIAVTQAGGGNAVGLKTETIPVTLSFKADLSGIRNERTGQLLANGREFKLDWKMNEALVLSFADAK